MQGSPRRTVAFSSESASSPCLSQASGPPGEEAATEPLLKYEEPVLARPAESYPMAFGHESLPQYVSLYSSSLNQGRRPQATSATGLPYLAGGGALGGRKRAQGRGEASAILRAIIPNRIWEDESGEWVQTVSNAGLSRGELTELRGKVDQRLRSMQARPGGVCAVREKLFSELFDELIRQVTIECPERGLLLLRVRDQARMTLETYVELHRDSIEFSKRKAEEARVEEERVKAQLDHVETDVRRLQGMVETLKSEEAMLNRFTAFTKRAAEQQYTEQLQSLQAEHSALKSSIAKWQRNSAPGSPGSPH